MRVSGVGHRQPQLHSRGEELFGRFCLRLDHKRVQRYRLLRCIACRAVEGSEQASIFDFGEVRCQMRSAEAFCSLTRTRRQLVAEGAHTYGRMTHFVRRCGGCQHFRTSSKPKLLRRTDDDRQELLLIFILIFMLCLVDGTPLGGKICSFVLLAMSGRHKFRGVSGLNEPVPFENSGAK